MDDRRCAMCLTERNARIVSKPTDEMHPVYACNECVEYSVEHVGAVKTQDPRGCDTGHKIEPVRYDDDDFHPDTKEPKA